MIKLRLHYDNCKELFLRLTVGGLELISIISPFVLAELIMTPKTITALLLLFALIGAASAAAIFSANEGDSELGMAMESLTSDDDMVKESCTFRGYTCEWCYQNGGVNCHHSG